jgi:hypothetical protein
MRLRRKQPLPLVLQFNLGEEIAGSDAHAARAAHHIAVAHEDFYAPQLGQKLKYTRPRLMYVARCMAYVAW